MTLKPIEDIIMENPPGNSKIDYEWVYKYVKFLDMDLNFDMIFPLNESLLTGLKIIEEEGVRSIEANNGMWLAYEENGKWEYGEFGPLSFWSWLSNYEEIEVNEVKFNEILNKL